VQLLVVTATRGQGAAPTVGASGGVFGVLLAFAFLFPHSRVMLIFLPIPMKAWVLVAGYAVIELTSGVFGTMQGVAHFAHLGGMLGARAHPVLLVALREPPDALLSPTGTKKETARCAVSCRSSLACFRSLETTRGFLSLSVKTASSSHGCSVHPAPGESKRRTSPDRVTVV
jgi:hypothetical protein